MLIPYLFSTHRHCWNTK